MSPRVSGASAGSDSVAAGGVGVGESPKKRSVLERWNRDLADQNGMASSSPTKKVEGRWSGRSQSVDIRDSSTFKSFARPVSTLASLPSPSALTSDHSPALTKSLSPSTSKTNLFPPRGKSAQGSPILSSGPSPPRVRGDPSPRFDSPTMDDSTWGEVASSSSTTTSPVLHKTALQHSTAGGGRVAPSRGWTAPPIGVKEYKKPGILSSSSSKEDGTLGLGIGKEKVALPGMIVPSKRPLTANPPIDKSIPMDEDTPRPWSPSKRPTVTQSNFYSSSSAIPTLTRSAKEVVNSFNQRSISATKLNEVLAGSPPRSSVKNAIATWGTPSRSTSNSSLNGAAGGVLGVTYPTPKRIRTVSQEMTQQETSIPRATKNDNNSITIFSLSSTGALPLPLGHDSLVLYETESILLHDPKSIRAYAWTGRENSLHPKEQQRMIKHVSGAVKEVVRFVQGVESRDFVELLGGRLIVRQVRPPFPFTSEWDNG